HGSGHARAGGRGASRARGGGGIGSPGVRPPARGGAGQGRRGVTAVSWTGPGRRLLGVRLGGGAAVVAVAWFLAAGKAEPDDQIPLAGLSVVGALVGMYGVFAWVARGRRLIGERARFLLGVAPTTGIGVSSATTLVP